MPSATRASTCAGRAQITVLYFDDPMIKDIQNRTRCCNDVRTWCALCLRVARVLLAVERAFHARCCGGMGERVMISNTFCFSMCARGLFPCPCIPSCCPEFLCPCMLSYNLYVKVRASSSPANARSHAQHTRPQDANKAVAEIQVLARRAALSSTVR